MNKTKFSQSKAKRAVEISSKIEGHKLPKDPEVKKKKNKKSSG